MVKKINPLFKPTEDGVYINGKYFGPANGYYENGVPASLNGCYEGGMFKNGIYKDGHWVENANGLYLNNVRQPFVDGWYRDGKHQTNQFQQVLESLRLKYDPEHWASWTLNGSLEEDEGRFPLMSAAGHEWVDMGARKAVRFDGSNSAGLYYGTDEDFTWVHEERTFSIGVWLTPVEYSTVKRIIGTNDPASTSQNGFSGFKSDGRSYFDLPHTTNYQRHISVAVVRSEGFPQFYLWQGTGTGGEYRDYYNGILSGRVAIAGTPRTGHSYTPLTIGYRTTNTIWNAFATNAVLTNEEIHQLYQAGLADIMI